jgi:LasA protease
MNKLKLNTLILLAILLVTGLAGCSREQEATPAPGEPTRTRSASATAGATAPGTEAIPDASATGLANVGALPEPSPPPQVYIVQPGDTLSGIASRFGCDLDALVSANSITDPNALQVGQKLTIPSTELDTGPATILLSDSEFVYGPAYVNFDTGAFAVRQGGYLAEYYENVGGEQLSGPEIINLVAHHYSVGPRLLLAILELRSGWVTNPSPGGAALSYPMGYRGSGWELLSQQLAWAANELNQGYYDWRGRGVTFITWGDGTATRYAPTLNAATAGLQTFFSRNANKSQWLTSVGEGTGSFIETYRRLFGDPQQYAVEPLIPANTTCPTLSLPWSKGELWYYTGGPHGAWVEGSAWAALDFVPDEGYLGCQPATAWATAMAPGLVIYSQNGEVLIDLDGDGHEQTGWVLFYLHVGSEGRVPVDTRVKAGDHIGHPSCEGGFSESSHLHIARKFNGEWIAADGPIPFVLDGWVAHSAGTEYDGSLTRGTEERTACECRDAAFNGLVAGE